MKIIQKMLLGAMILLTFSCTQPTQSEPTVTPTPTPTASPTPQTGTLKVVVTDNTSGVNGHNVYHVVISGYDSSNASVELQFDKQATSADWNGSAMVETFVTDQIPSGQYSVTISAFVATGMPMLTNAQLKTYYPSTPGYTLYNQVQGWQLDAGTQKEIDATF